MSILFLILYNLTPNLLLTDKKENNADGRKPQKKKINTNRLLSKMHPHSVTAWLIKHDLFAKVT